MAAIAVNLRRIRRSAGRVNVVLAIVLISAVVRGRRFCMVLPFTNGRPGGEGRLDGRTAESPSCFPAGAAGGGADRVVVDFAGVGGLSVGVARGVDAALRPCVAGAAACRRRVCGCTARVAASRAACAFRWASAPPDVAAPRGLDGGVAAYLTAVMIQSYGVPAA